MSAGVPFGGITAPALRQLLARYLKPWCFTDIEFTDIAGAQTTDSGDLYGAVFTDGTTISGDGTSRNELALIKPLTYNVRATSTTPDPVTATDVFVLSSATAGADIVEDLPAATGSGRVLIFKKMDANAHNVVITPNGADMLDGANAVVNITIQYDAVRLLDAAAGAWVIW